MTTEGCQQNKIQVAVKKMTSAEKEELMKRLPKRLTYILRYGAVKEGLTVDHNGFVRLDELNLLPLLAEYSYDEILQEIESSVSYRTNKRYESRERNGIIEVRAAYLRNFEESPVHQGTKVKTLVESSMTCILNNLDDYDLQDFPDEDIIRRMIRRLKRQKKLTIKALHVLLVPTITGLDLEGVLLNNNVLRTIYKNCPNLNRISFKGCGYMITDNVLSQIVKNLPNLEKLNVCQCNHLTAQSLYIINKRLTRLNTLHAAGVFSLSFKSVLDFLNKAKALSFLDIYFMRFTPDEYEQLTKSAASKGVTLILRKPKTGSKEELKAEQEDANHDANCGDPNVDSVRMECDDPNVLVPMAPSDLEEDWGMDNWCYWERI